MQEIEENNRMGKTRDLIKKIRHTKGTFQAKVGSIEVRNGIDLTEAEGIKKRWQEYTEELYKKDIHDPDNYDGVITHLEPDILECEVLLSFILYSKAKFACYSRCFLTSYFWIPVPYNEKDIFFGC